MFFSRFLAEEESSSEGKIRYIEKSCTVSNRRRPDFKPRSTVCVRDLAIKALLYIHNFSFPRFFHSLSSFSLCVVRQLRFFMLSSLRVYISSRTLPRTRAMHTRQPCSFASSACAGFLSCISHSVVSSLIFVVSPPHTRFFFYFPYD